MKILITAFLCAFVSANHSTGSNSSLFESKIVNGKPYKEDESLFKIRLIARIIFSEPYVNLPGETYKFTSMGAFYTRNSVLTSRTCAYNIHFNMGRYFVLRTPMDDSQALSIADARFTSKREGGYGIIKLCNKADIDLNGHININQICDADYNEDAEFYSPGWTHNNNKILFLQYLTLKMINMEVCREALDVYGYKLQSNEICLRSIDGYFEAKDKGTPLYASYNRILGIANSFRFLTQGIIIYTLLAGQEEPIKSFLSPKRNTNDQGADTEQFTRAQALNRERQDKWNRVSFPPNTVDPIDFEQGEVGPSRNSRLNRHSESSNSERQTPDQTETSPPPLRTNNDGIAFTCNVFKSPVPKIPEKYKFWKPHPQKM